MAAIADAVSQAHAIQINRRQVKQIAQFPQQRAHAARRVKIFHIAIAGRLQIHQNRRFLGQRIQPLEVKRKPSTAGNRCHMHHRIGGTAKREQHAHGIVQIALRHHLAGQDGVLDEPHGLRAGFLRNAKPIGMHGGRTRPGQRHKTKGRRNAGHGGSRAHHAASAGGGGKLAFQFADPRLGHFPGAITRPIAPAIRAGGKPLTFKSLRQHGAGDEHHGWDIRRNRRHKLRRHGLVAATHQHRRIHRLGGKHRFRIKRHEVPIMHGTGAERWLTQAYCREAKRQSAFGKHAAAHGFDQFRHRAVAVIIVARGIGNADHGLVQHALRIAHGFGEGPPEVKREIAIPVIGGIAGQAMGFVAHAGGSSEKVAVWRQISILARPRVGPGEIAVSCYHRRKSAFPLDFSEPGPDKPASFP